MTIDSALQDVRFAVRSYMSRPTFTAVAVVTIALGIGGNTAIFSLVNAAVMDGVPGVADMDRVVEISRDLEGSYFDVSYPIYRQLAEETAGLESLAAVDLEPVSVAASGDPVMTLSASVSASYFDVVSAAPARGRFFGASEATPPTSAPLAVISENFWRTRLGSDPSVVGSTLRISGTEVTVIGVAGGGFRGHSRVPVDVFLPLGVGIRGLRSAEFLGGIENGVVELIGKVQPGASLRAVASAATEAGDRLLQAELGSEPGTFQARVEPWAPIPASARGPITLFLALLMVIVGTVLIVACINVAGMLLSRSIERNAEFAVRRALGADSWRIARQLFVESLILFLAGGAAGILVSVWLTRLLLSLEPPLPAGFEITLDAGLDGRVLGFALAATVLTAIGVNLLPVLRFARPTVASGIRAAHSPVGTRARSWLVAAQMAGSLTLLVAAALFLRALASVESLDPGWETDNVYSADLDLALIGVDGDEGRATYDEVVERIAGLPGVESVALASRPPLAGRSVFGVINVAGVEPPEGRSGFEIALNRVSANYFRTLGIDLRAGRDFGPEDTSDGALVAIVNDEMAGLLWPEQSPIGRSFSLGPVGSERSFTVVGVVENTAVADLSGEEEPFYYLPFSQWYNSQMSLLVRSMPTGGASVPSSIRQIVREVEPALPLEAVLPLRERLSVFLLPQRLAAWVSGVIGLLGLVLSAVGVYGVTAYSVEMRRREIGVRLAVGALPADIVRSVSLRALRAPLVGIAIGLVLSLLIWRAAAGFLAGVGPADPASYLAALVTLIGAAAIAAILPARRASRIDPASSLRAE
jgi:predicted permease